MIGHLSIIKYIKLLKYINQLQLIKTDRLLTKYHMQLLGRFIESSRYETYFKQIYQKYNK